MAWEVKVVIDKTGDLANVSATWTDETLGEFTYSRRSRVGVAQADVFFAEAVAARDAWQIYQENNNTKSAWATNRLNTNDPKVV